MMGIIIRIAEYKDIDDIRRILLRNHKEDYKKWPSIYMPPDIKKGPSEIQIRENINSEEDLILIACKKNAIIGIILSELCEGAAPLKEKQYVLIKRLYVTKKHRRKGIAIKLINKVKEHHANKGIDEVRLHVFGHNKKALKLYTKLGFTYLVSLMTDYTYSRR